MKELNLNELLSYGFAGAVFLAFLLLAYSEPGSVVAGEAHVALVTAGLIAVGLTTGCVIYSLHRAIPYPVFYWIFAKLNGRGDKTIDMDINRWRNLQRADALQSRMGEWGAQVHFLYCLAWAGFLSICLGELSSWKRTNMFPAAVLTSLLFFVSAAWHHYRYQKWEKRVFDEDKAMPNKSLENTTGKR